MYTAAPRALGAAPGKGRKRRAPYLDNLTVPARRDPVTGRFLDQSATWRKRNGLGSLGFNPFDVIGAAFGPPGTAPGMGPGMPGMPGASNTVSPNIQTTITPTISPTFTQVQDSAGARVASSTSATPSTSQRATGVPQQNPMAPPTPPSLPNFQYDYTAPDPVARWPGTAAGSGPDFFREVFTDQQSIPWTAIILGASAVAGVLLYTRKR